MYDYNKAQPSNAVQAQGYARETAEGDAPTMLGGAGPGSEIADTLAQQEKATHILLETVAALETKLNPVLTPCPPSPADAAMPSRVTPIAGCIQENTERIGRAIMYLPVHSEPNGALTVLHYRVR